MRVFLFLILSIVSICGVPVSLDLKSQDVGFQPVAITPVENGIPVIGAGSGNGTLLSGHVFRTVKRYFCWLNQYECQSDTLLYGTNGWIFPKQDVNLTLSYPSVHPNVEEIEDYLIVGYQVIMFTDGSGSAGFITGGGLLQSKEIQPIEEELDATPILVNGVLYKTVKKYYCSLWDDEDSVHTIVYGQKGWTFTRQDVNLTLAYPSKEVAKLEGYVITGFQVVLFIDGTESKAHISSGGLLQDSINFTFICAGITTVSYQFWLYGTHRSALPSRQPVNLCE